MAKRINYDQAYTDKFAGMNQAAVQALSRIGGDPVPEEPDPEEPKTTAPKAADSKKSMLKDYSRQTYWLKKEYIEKVKDIAYTERKTVRQTINRLLSLALDQIDKEYQAEGKKLEHYEGEEEL